MRTAARVLGVLGGIIGIGCGALAGRPTASWILMAFAGVVGFVCIKALWALPGIMLIVGAALEFATRHRKKSSGV